MAKKHWKSPECPDWIQRRYVDIITTGGLLSLGDGYRVRSDALAWHEGATALQNSGFMPDPPGRGAHDEIERIEKSGDVVALAKARVRLSLELAQEDRNALRWSALQIWGEQDSAVELAEKARAERAEQDRRARIVKRTEELLRSEDEKRRAKAAATAEKELA